MKTKQARWPFVDKSTPKGEPKFKIGDELISRASILDNGGPYFYEPCVVHTVEWRTNYHEWFYGTGTGYEQGWRRETCMALWFRKGEPNADS